MPFRSLFRSRTQHLWARACGSSTPQFLESDYISLITGFWSLSCGRTFAFPTLAEWWDTGKAQIKRLSVDYCLNRAKAKRVERDLLSRLVVFLKEKLDSGATYCLAPYQTALSNLGKSDLEIAHGAQVRSCVRWTERVKLPRPISLG